MKNLFVKSKYGNKAVSKVISSINMKQQIENIELPEYNGDFFEGMLFIKITLNNQFMLIFLKIKMPIIALKA